MCFFCKRRKIKCDKGNPCAACVKYNESVCEYENVQDPKSNGVSLTSYGGAVLDLDVRVPASTSSSSLNAAPKRSNKRTSEVQDELEVLKRKISMLEKSVSLTHNLDDDLRLAAQDQHALCQQFPQQQQQQHPSLLHLSQLKTSVNSFPSPMHPNQSQNVNPYWLNSMPSNHSVRSGHSTSSMSSITTPNHVDLSPIWSKSEDLMVNLIGSNPFPPGVSTFSFHSNYAPFISTGTATARYLPPLCWVSLVRLDPAMSPIFWYKKGTIHNRIKYEKPIQASDKVFQDKFALINVETGKYDNPTRRHFASEKLEMVTRFNESALLVGLTVFEGEIDPNSDIAQKIRLLLPTRKVIWLLLDRFFARVYPFYPFLDQIDFEQQVQEILGSRNKDHVPVKSLNISKKMDVITCGLLLLVLRLSYLSVFSNDLNENEALFKGLKKSEDSEECTFIMENPIHIDVIDIAQQCLHYFGYLRYCNLPILQLSIFIQLYQCYAPENGEGYEDITVKGHTAMLMNMAMSLGLHREPDNFALSSRDPKINHLCRKIWWYLLILDSHATTASGVALCTRRNQFDTKPPFYTEGCANIKDIRMEKTIIGILSGFDARYDDICKLSDFISNVAQPISVSELTACLNRLETRYLSEFANGLTFEELRGEALLNQSIYQEVTRSVRMKILFQSHVFFISIAFHFFCSFEKSGNIDHAYFHLKKLLYTTLKMMMPYYDSYVDESLIFFKHTGDNTITPAFQALLHKSMIYVQAILIRARFSILQCETSTSHTVQLLNNPHYKRRYELLKETWDLAEKCLMIMTANTTKLGNRFYYSWRCAKAQVVLKEIRQGTDYYLNYRKGQEIYMLLTNPMLEDLNQLLRSALERCNGHQKNATQEDLSASLPPVFEDESGRPMSTAPMSDMNCPFHENNLWQQMIKVKPRLHKSLKYSLTPPTVDYNLGVDLNDVPTYQNETFFPEQQFTGLNFFDSLFDDISKPDF